jgi:hypothetical protein
LTKAIRSYGASVSSLGGREPALLLFHLDLMLSATLAINQAAACGRRTQTMAAGNGAAHSKYPDHMQMAGARFL